MSSKTKLNWSKLIRPLLWWLVFVLVLLGYHFHEQWSLRTRLSFSLSVDGKGPIRDTLPQVDGKNFLGGMRIGFGRHTLTVTRPQTEPFTTNFFVWYGRKDLGTLDLKRSRGVLSICANPPAAILTISGPEFNEQFNNSTGGDYNVPTDDYQIHAKYKYWHDSQNQTVIAGKTASCNFNPPLGALRIASAHPKVAFQLLDDKGQPLERGILPATLPDLVTGEYRLAAVYQNYPVQKSVTVTAGATNEVSVEFAVGAVQLESVPAGAAVYAATDGSSVGVTPIMITNLLPSIVAYKLQAAGYEDAMVSATVIENQTTAVSTNLVKLEYRSNLNLAKSLLQSGNYDQALAAVDLAIAAKPGDAEATSLRQEISVRQLMQQAHDLAGQSDYAGAAAKLAAALQIQPDNRDVQSLMTQLQTERQNRPGQIFAAVLKKVPNSSLFEQHLMTTSKPAKDVQAAVVAVLKSSNPPFQVLPVETPEPDIYKIYLTQTLARGVLDTPYRECAIVVGQSKPDETQIWFKVMEFQIHHDAVLNSLIHVQDKKEYIPVHPSRIQMTDELQAQVRDGTKVMADKIIQAIEQP